MSDLRAMMKARAGSGGLSSTMNQSKEKARLLKQARQMQMQQGQPMDKKNIVPSALQHSTDITESVTEKKKSKTIDISTLTKKEEEATTTAVAASVNQPNPGAMFASYAEDDDDETDDNVAPVKAVEVSAGRQFYVPSSTSAHSSNTKSADEPTAAGGLNLPPGFFDNPREDMEARGLNVKEEIRKKELEQEEALQAFLGEVQTIAADDAADEEESDDGEREEMNEMALQLAYETKTAALMAKIERGLDQIKDGSTVSQSGEMSIDINDVDHMIEEASGVKRRAEDGDVYDDVMTALRQKKMRLDSLKGANSKDTTSHHNKQSSKSVSVEQEEEESAAESSDGDDSSYEPLDFTDWQSRTL